MAKKYTVFPNLKSASKLKGEALWNTISYFSVYTVFFFKLKISIGGDRMWKDAFWKEKRKNIKYS